MSDVFGRRHSDDRLEAEISTAIAERVHRRARVSRWSAGVALAGALALAVLAVVVLLDDIGRGVPPFRGLAVSAVAGLAAVAAVAIAITTRTRTRRLLASSAPEGGIVLGLSSAGVHLAHLPLLEWSAVTAVAVADRSGRSGMEVVVGLAVANVGATRARVIDARLTHVVRPFPRTDPPARRHASELPGFLTVSLADLLDAATIDEAIRRLQVESTSRDIPFHRVPDRRRLVDVLRRG